MAVLMYTVCILRAVSGRSLPTEPLCFQVTVSLKYCIQNILHAVRGKCGTAIFLRSVAVAFCYSCHDACLHRGWPISLHKWQCYNTLIHMSLRKLTWGNLYGLMLTYCLHFEASTNPVSCLYLRPERSVNLLLGHVSNQLVLCFCCPYFFMF